MEEPEEYVVEEKVHFISKRVEAEPAEGIPTLKLILAYVCLACPVLYLLLPSVYQLYWIYW